MALYHTGPPKSIRNRQPAEVLPEQVDKKTWRCYHDDKETWQRRILYGKRGYSGDQPQGASEPGSGELEASVQAGNLAGRVGAGVCCLVSALFVQAVHTVLLGPWVIYFSILGTHALVKFLKLKRKTDLVFTVLYLVMFLLFLVFFIRRLMEAAE